MSDGMKRRDFLKVLGVSGAGAATAGCSTGDVEKLIPYVIPSEDIVPGIPTYYTSTCRECPAGCGIHVETHEGRATKVEGNPDHPISRGNLCARGQASVQGLYHPDRFQGPVTREPGVRDTVVTWGTAERLLAQRIREIQQAGGGGGIVFLTQDYTGTMNRLADEFVGAIGARRVIFDPWQAQPRGLQFADANYLISFGADFLETWGSPVEYSWQFAQMHSYRNGRRGKFVWVGPHRPLTGLNADQWLAPRPGTEHLLAQALAGRLDSATAAQQTEIPQATIDQIAQEFRAAGGVALGPGAAISGPNASQLRDAIGALNAGRGGNAGVATRPSGREMIQLVQQMNAGQVQLLLIDAQNPAYTLPTSLGFRQALERVPTRVSFSSFPDETAELATMLLPNHHFLEAWDDYIPEAGVNELIQPVMRPVFNTKQVGDVLISVAAQLGTPVGGGLANTYYDYLRTGWAGLAGGEAWREAVRRGGVYPAPLTPGTGAAGFLPLQGATAGAGVVGAGAATTDPSQTTANLATTGQTGEVLQADVQQPATPAGPAPSAPVAAQGDANGNLNLVVYPSYRFYDGRTANRPWLLELPDPVTKVPWESWVEIHPRTAEEMGIAQGDLVEVTSQHGSVTTWAYVYPGVRPDTVAIQMGLGHAAGGRWTAGLGVNPNALLGPTLDEATGSFAGYGVRVRIAKTDKPSIIPGMLLNGEKFFNPSAGLFEQGVRVQYDREIAQAISVASLATQERQGHPSVPGSEPIESLRGKGGFLPIETPTDPAAYPPPATQYGEYFDSAPRWAMVVDLSRCIGCSACVTACYAENNIPVVGATEMKKGRDLSWLRIERYFHPSGDDEAAMSDTGTNDVRFLPMLCQHCGNAPCEPVCPVYAAYHTPDGLNGQVYNRCVGTRYCANNCPYKVRYFNWWTYDFPEPLNWQLNPDVTVREKGVMEKCTFCVQRIREGKHNAATENRPMTDGDVVPACVQTCPTEVFVFGNISDPNSAVSRAAQSVRGYRALEVTNAQPAIVYLKKVTLQEPAHGGHATAATTESAVPAEAH
ncbi:MAG: 4Fe-4S dicluster domain-containing protein [Gemmatimonadetes bacterium]|nr:4Fe-4S dicluster domain-containing protein [Gemmatimonadota bacterium]